MMPMDMHSRAFQPLHATPYNAGDENAIKDATELIEWAIL